MKSPFSNLGPAHRSRREFLQRASAAGAGLLLPASGLALAQSATPPDYTLEITEIDWDIGAKKKIRTTAYGGRIPGPLLRVREGQTVSIDVINRLDREEIVHWHGQWIPPDVDGSMEEGTPMIPAGGRTRIQFTPRPNGLHWYHTHAHSDHAMKHGLYSGQFGVLMVEGGDNAGAWDQEQFLVLHEWEPYAAASDDGSEEVEYVYGTINGRILGHGDPIQVKQGQRILFHILNAGATQVRWLHLPAHSFEVHALDGRPVPTHARVDTLMLGPAERISAVVAMDHPGVWVLGEARESYRNAGTGIVIEYAGQTGKPVAASPMALPWDYRIFGQSNPAAPPPDAVIPLVFTSKFQGHGAMDKWMINGKSYPETDPVALKEGLRHRLRFDNRSRDDHPVHLHRHAFELVSIAGATTGGILKDVVVVKAGTVVEADLVAANPGPSLFHCHQQDHMDMGFMTIFRYS